MSQSDNEKKEFINVYCPVCQVKGRVGLLLKIERCLSGSRFIEIKCHRCRQVVRVP